MKILTWNINGVRASKVPLKRLFDDLDADVICLQETKVTRDQLDEKSAIVEGYNSYFSFSKARSGYSGVATFVRDSAIPLKAEEGLSGYLMNDDTDTNIRPYGDQSVFSDEELESLDKEGRAILTQHKLMTDEGEEKLLTVINVYCPRADPEKEDRKSFKLRFYELLQIRAEAILASGSHVIILGDINTSHRPIDNCDPGDEQEFRARPDRRWLDQLLNGQQITDHNNAVASCGGKFVDTFRQFHPMQKEAYTCWSTVTGARATNYGTRIDYILADVKLTNSGVTDCIIMPDVEGSDHCPVKASLKWEFIAAKKCPPLCTKYLPEFAGKQQKLSAFLKRTVKPNNSGTENSQLGQKDIGEGGSQSCQTKCEETQANSLKRSASDPEKLAPNVKKPKLDKSTSSGKQSSLMAFFGKPKSAAKSPGKDLAGTDSNVTSNVQNSVQTDEVCSQEKHVLPPDCTTHHIQEENALKPKSEVATSWKGLLKGPAPPPLCKGHKEPCVLRTVKKESLNKGRQFYVCNRPDGAKDNPLARCDHFEWVEKKKKGSS